MQDYGLRKNCEGYSDPTAYQAMANIIREEKDQQKRLSALVTVLKTVIDLAGYDLLNRIELRERKTGREFR